VKHTLTTLYQLYDGTSVPVDITFRHYTDNDHLEFIWATIPEPHQTSAKLRIVVESWAANWLREHRAEALAIAKGDQSPGEPL